ncbi:MAG: FAD-dependent oxidoreductase [Bdellovibrionales bacterium]|nr:FAD-dependent oxidoreductase [Bdellovibrionales bacterium]
MNQKPVAIVGGGLSGIACARVLHEKNIPFVLFEKSSILGGRVQSENVQGYVLDKGFQVLLTSYEKTMSLLDLSSIQLKAFDPGAIIRSRDHFHEISDPFRDPWGGLRTLFSSVGSLGDKLLTLKQRIELQEKKDHEIFNEEEYNSHEYFRRRGFSASIVEEFYEPFFRGVFLDQDLSTSSRYLRYLLKKFSLGKACIPKLGMSQIPLNMAKPLPSESIRLNTSVSHIEGQNLFLEGGEHFEFSHLVLAIEFDAIGKIIPSIDLSIRWNGTECFYFEAPRAPRSEKKIFLNAEYVRSFDLLAIPSNIHPSQAKEEKALVSVSRIQGSSSRDEKEIKDELQTWFGDEVDQWKLIHSYSISKALPQIDHLKPPESRVLPEHPFAFICGDYTRHPSIEGAVESGYDAATWVIEQQKKI